MCGNEITKKVNNLNRYSSIHHMIKHFCHNFFQLFNNELKTVIGHLVPGLGHLAPLYKINSVFIKCKH